MTDQRYEQAAELFKQASKLLSDLTALGRRLPPPDMRSGKLPPDWNEEKSYGLCVDLLRLNLDSTIQRVQMDLGIRKEFQISAALFGER
jgi:hypothetical protein